jgi:hypothetical protein
MNLLNFQFSNKTFEPIKRKKQAKQKNAAEDDIELYDEIVKDTLEGMTNRLALQELRKYRLNQQASIYKELFPSRRFKQIRHRKFKSKPNSLRKQQSKRFKPKKFSDAKITSNIQDDNAEVPEINADINMYAKKASTVHGDSGKVNTPLESQPHIISASVHPPLESTTSLTTDDSILNNMLSFVELLKAHAKLRNRNIQIDFMLSDPWILNEKTAIFITKKEAWLCVSNTISSEKKSNSCFFLI